MSHPAGPAAGRGEQQQLSLEVVTVVLALSLWLATGSLAIGIADSGPHPTRRLLLGAAIVAVTAMALLGRRTVWSWLRIRPWLVMPIAIVQLGVAAIDGLLPAGPYVAFSLTSVALAVFVARPHTVWLTVALLECGYAAAILVHQTPSQLEASGNLSGVAGTVLGYPCVALVGLGLVRLLARFTARADGWLEALRAGAPALTPALTLAIARGPRPLPQLPAPSRALWLTPAEARVVRALVQGSVPKQIAYDQGVSLPTVRSHLKHAKRKAGARTLTELVARAAASDLIDRGS